MSPITFVITVQFLTTKELSNKMKLVRLHCVTPNKWDPMVNYSGHAAPVL